MRSLLVSRVRSSTHARAARPRSRSRSQSAAPTAAPTPPVSGASTLLKRNRTPLISPLSASSQSIEVMTHSVGACSWTLAPGAGALSPRRRRLAGTRPTPRRKPKGPLALALNPSRRTATPPSADLAARPAVANNAARYLIYSTRRSKRAIDRAKKAARIARFG